MCFHCKRSTGTTICPLKNRDDWKLFSAVTDAFKRSIEQETSIPLKPQMDVVMIPPGIHELIPEIKVTSVFLWSSRPPGTDPWHLQRSDSLMSCSFSSCVQPIKTPDERERAWARERTKCEQKRVDVTGLRSSPSCRLLFPGAWSMWGRGRGPCLSYPVRCDTWRWLPAEPDGAQTPPDYPPQWKSLQPMENSPGYTPERHLTHMNQRRESIINSSTDCIIL